MTRVRFPQQVTLTCDNPACSNYKICLSRQADVTDGKLSVVCSGCGKRFEQTATSKEA